ncbi:TIGR03086 family protein [Streptomyces sp. 3MP-14]|uniref:TIGR03086 family protein n=1 Tax=Streptomyces mimosae TaxID=2586635 RepID=A0A5N6A661_9ACTN|nr:MULTISPECIES: TIGR03086 family metal-binding protein [Streptomyces]KAB8163712.1 TIGR03086 family protein [Streptomyces mimosae]KAB8175155.1 TIGR03086 family protein [Streptomyces sp. 3MP-14]
MSDQTTTTSGNGSPDGGLPDLGPVTERLAGLLDGVTEDHFDAPTPCPDMAVRDLLSHLLGLTLAFRDAARKELGPATDVSPGDPNALMPAPVGDWRGQLRSQLAELVEAWRDPAAWRGETRAGGIDLPGQVAGAVALNEVLIHGWDLARATGQPYDVDPESAGVSIELLAADADDPKSRENGPFGPAQPVPAGATPLERAVALSGRTPSWTPPNGA